MCSSFCIVHMPGLQDMGTPVLVERWFDMVHGHANVRSICFTKQPDAFKFVDLTQGSACWRMCSFLSSVRVTL
jgi:hypothetical protein